MAAMKFLLAMVLVIVVVAQKHIMVESQAQSACSSSLSTLNVCAPFVVPGSAANPSSDCCGALQAVDHDCLCSTLRIASRIPVQCNLPPLSCGTQ
ncbi:Bifunctional inhibitor/lipid-transfer protein/seed storage 2S albumin superfamily protein [Perilla frutescens var. hirtella]|nr:Bifunctional inhibitor/lipid-transfer protein/seed storage 2S albumin superfamily protein [Perilla frutescens var. hirtella]KAH6815531.1 Bifunctional inhibitor/lipid-transfer protein/seed storage 2S albumin superfamily protein [Perilla frutescens var. frutescens]